MCAYTFLQVCSIKDCHTKPARTHKHSAFAFALPTCCHIFATAFLNLQQFPSFPLWQFQRSTHTLTRCTFSLVAFSVVLHLFLSVSFVQKNILHLNLSLAHAHIQTLTQISVSLTLVWLTVIVYVYLIALYFTLRIRDMFVCIGLTTVRLFCWFIFSLFVFFVIFNNLCGPQRDI